MLELNAKKTALVIIDLQEGILPFAGGPHRADEVVTRAAKLAENVVNRVRPSSWFEWAGPPISPKR